MSNDLLNITVTIADRPYRLKVQQHEEEAVRNAAKELNHKINEYQNSYHANDKQDYLAMAALLFTTEHLAMKDSEKNHAQVSDAMFQTLNQSLLEIEQVLSKD